MLPDSRQHDDLVMGLVELALARPAAEREVYVRSACAGNTKLFQEVWHYVVAEERMNGFLVEPLCQGLQEALQPPNPDRTTQQIFEVAIDLPSAQRDSY